jgi:thioredoxin-related protein
LFYDCPKVSELWKIIDQWLQQKDETIQLDKHMVLFGSLNTNHKFVNWLIVNVKHCIYRTKLQKNILHITGIKNVLKDKLQIEKYILYKNCSHKEFDENWAPWQRCLEN